MSAASAGDVPLAGDVAVAVAAVEAAGDADEAAAAGMCVLIVAAAEMTSTVNSKNCSSMAARHTFFVHL